MRYTIFARTDSIDLLAVNSAILGGTNSNSESLVESLPVARLPLRSVFSLCSLWSRLRPVYIVAHVKRDTSNSSAGDAIHKWRVILPGPFAGLRSSLFIILIINNQPILHATLPIRYPALLNPHHYYPHIITLNIATT